MTNFKDFLAQLKDPEFKTEWDPEFKTEWEALRSGFRTNNNNKHQKKESSNN